MFLIENKTDSVNFTKIKHILIFLLYCNRDIKSKEKCIKDGKHEFNSKPNICFKNSKTQN